MEHHIKAAVKPGKNKIKQPEQTYHADITFGKKGIDIHLVPVIPVPQNAKQQRIHCQQHKAKEEKHSLTLLLAVVFHNSHLIASFQSTAHYSNDSP